MTKQPPDIPPEVVTSYRDIMPTLAALAGQDKARVPYDFVNDPFVRNLGYGIRVPEITAKVIQRGAGTGVLRVVEYLHAFGLDNEQSLTDPDYSPELPGEDEIPEDAIIRMLFNSFAEAVYEWHGTVLKDRVRGASYMGLLGVQNALKFTPVDNGEDIDVNETKQTEPLKPTGTE